MPTGPISYELLALAVSAVNALSAGFTQFSEHPDNRYRDKVKKLQKDRWSEVSTELGEILHEVENKAESFDQPEGEELTEAALYSYIIQQELDAGELGDLTEMVEDVDKPKNLFQTVRTRRDQAVKYFGTGLILSILGAGLLYIAGPQTSTSAISFWIIAGGLFSTMRGFICVKAWFDTRQELDQLWEEYDFM